MRTVYLGDSILFAHSFFDSFGAAYDPPEVTFHIVKNATQFLTKAYTYSEGDVIRNAIGDYEYEHEISPFTTPGLFSARWDAEIEGVNNVFFEQYQVIERPPEPSTILDAPRRFGVMVESPLYRTLGVGDTGRLFLVGHADGLALNDPYQIRNMQEAVNALGAHHDSPMIRALLEAYNFGARDIWLVAAAPESEYVPYDANDSSERFLTRDIWGGLNFYQKYYDRLTTTYQVLRDFDYPELIVPIEAPFYNAGDVDFLTQLINHCGDAYALTSAPRIGIIGSRVGSQDPSVTVGDLESDSRFSTDYGSDGKFVMTVLGEGTYKLPQMPISHTSSLSVAVGALMSILPFNTGPVYKQLNNVITAYGRQLKKDEIKTLTNLKINPAIRTAKGVRGSPYQVVLATDNTMSSEGSDFWSVVQMRLVAEVITQIRTLGLRSLGTIGYMQFKQDVSNYMQRLVLSDSIRSFELAVNRDPTDRYKAVVEVNLTPYFGVREIYFSVAVGPGV